MHRARTSFAALSLVSALACSEASPGPTSVRGGAANEGGTLTSGGQAGALTTPSAGTGVGGANGGATVSAGAGGSGGASSGGGGSGAGGSGLGGSGGCGGGGSGPVGACGPSDPISTDRVCSDLLERGSSGQHKWGSSYSHWSGKGGTAFEQKIRIEVPAPSTFHTQYFDLTNASGGYVGLQTGSIANGKLKTQVRFSLWNALHGTTDEAESVCQTFGGEGVGWTCYIPTFEIEFGVFYTLAVERLQDSADGKVWWQATVTNDRALTKTVIGRIQTLHTSQPHQFKTQQNFSEYWGPRAIDCDHVPRSIVDWQKPHLVDDGANVPITFEGFSKAGNPSLCAEEGTFASGEELTEDGKTLYRMTNGSIQMCE